MTTLFRVIGGNADPSEITAAPAPIGMLNATVWFPAVVFAEVIASRKEQSASQVPSLVSAIFVTVKVAAWASEDEPTQSVTAMMKKRAKRTRRHTDELRDRFSENFL